jgi:hypothetical protein
MLPLAWASAAGALEVPITVQELVPGGVTGLARTGEPVSVGVPLDPAEGITDASQLSLRGAAAAQFRVLQRDPETGVARWALVDFVTNSPGGAYSLVWGAGSFGGAALGTDQGTHIRIETGPATFEVRKSGFNFLDRVTQGSYEVVSPHAGGGVVVQSGTTRYESGLDTASETVLEENGPVKAVVRARGTLRSAVGAASLDYTVRLCFFRGQPGCRAFVTLRNADIASLSTRTFDAAWVEFPASLGAARTVQFGGPSGVLSGLLASGSAAHLFQGDNTFQRGGNTDAILPYLTPTRGLEVTIAGTALRGTGSTADVARGWMRVDDGVHAVLAGMRDLATLFPSGFDVQGDVLAVELFSRYNPQKNLVFSWGAHETREMLFEFAAPVSADPEAFRYRLQYPLLGKCDFGRYRDTGAVCGERRLVTVQEEHDFFAETGKNWTLAEYAESSLKLNRQYGFGASGGPNQFDMDECELLDFLRSGYSGHFLKARLGVLWKADQAVYHSDDFDYGTHQNGVSDVNVTQPASFHGKGAGSLFDDEHPHWTCMLLYYHMTGDENVREAIEDYGEWRRYRAGNPRYGAIHGGGVGSFRLWSRCFRDVALLYEFTGQQRYLDDVRFMSDVLTHTIETGTSKGRNRERGYFFFGDETDPTRLIHLFFLTEMNPIGVEEAMRVLPEGDARREELRDYLYGLAYFTLQEAQLLPSAIGYPYEYLSTVANPTLGVRGDQTGIVLTLGYEMSGDSEFVNRSRALAWRVLEYQNMLRGSELSTHLRIYRWLHRTEVGAEYVDPVVRSNPNGTYTLTWTAPVGAREYIVKYGAKPLVENLGFDQAARTYRVDPGLAMNFWAGTNLSGEPEPWLRGALESYTTPDLPAGTWYFKVKVLTSAARARTPIPIGRPPRHPANQRADSPGPLAAPGPVRVTPSPSPLQSPGGVVFARVPSGGEVRIYSASGRLVRALPATDRSLVTWDRRTQSGEPAGPGVYFYRIVSPREPPQRGRLVLVP